MFSEDVLEEMPVDSWEEGIQLIFFQEGGPITLVKVCTTSSRLEEEPMNWGFEKVGKNHNRL